MFAIYKKELRSYLHSMIGAVFMAFFLAIIGIYYFAYNLSMANASFELVLNGVAFVFIILVPIITMRLVSEEKKQKTDQLLYTSPLPVWKIMIGKYLAVLTLYAVVLIFTCIYPLMLTPYGDVQLKPAYTAIFGFALLGAAYMAIGLFVSSLTESQVLAAVITFLALLLGNLMGSLTQMVPSGAASNFVMLLVCLALICILLYFLLRQVAVSAAVAVIGAAVLTFIYLKKAAMLEGAMASVLGCFAVSDRLNNFLVGILDFGSVLYYLSVIVLCLFITIQHTSQSMMDRSNSGRMFRTTLSILLCAILVVVNLGAGKLDWSVDFSQDGWYSITNDTKEFLSKLEHDITIYHIVSDGNEDGILEKILKKYEMASSRVTVRKMDQVKNPAFVKKYTEDQLNENSCIVVNESTGASKTVDYFDMYQSDMDYTTYQEKTTGIDMEGLLTSAVFVVTSSNLPVAYQETGHGENALGTMAADAVEKMNVKLNSFSSVTETVPADCDILIINGPTTDFSEAEAEGIKEYLSTGGDAILTVSANATGDMPNYESILSLYHVKVNDGVVVETDGNYVESASPFYAVPYMGSDANIVGNIIYPVVSFASKGLIIEDYDDEDMDVVSVLDTSDDAYAKVAEESQTYTFEEGDIKGPFSLGAAVTNTNDNYDSKVAVFASAYLFDDTFYQFGNLQVLSNSIGWMAEMESTISIPVKNVDVSYLSIVNPLPLAVLVVFVIPGVFLIAGLIIWLKRKLA